MFEKATKIKLRFATPVGLISVEDVWDLPLKDEKRFSVDALARMLNKSLKESSVESFVDEKPQTDSVIELQFEITKHIISVKLKEREEARLAADRKLQKEKIMTLISDKQDEELKGKSLKDLEKMLKNL